MDTYDSIPPMDWSEVLKSSEYYDYDKFMLQFVSKMYGHSNWQQFHDFAGNDLYFAEQTIIPFIRLLLQCEQGQTHMDNIVVMLEYFFETFEQQYSGENHHPVERKFIYKEKRIVNLILNICECIRINNSWYVCVLPEVLLK